MIDEPERERAGCPFHHFVLDRAEVEIEGSVESGRAHASSDAADALDIDSTLSGYSR